MKINSFFSFFLSIFFFSVSVGCKKNNQPVVDDPNTGSKTLIISPARDSITVLHNPLMSLVKYAGGYADGNWDLAEWTTSDPNIVADCNIVYIRSPWVNFEPTEGNYVWKNNASFKSLIEGLKSKGFRLAFRVMCQDDGLDPKLVRGTPPYVIDAMKAGTYNVMSKSNPRYPDVTNPIWQEKFKTFILAFGKEFNDPAVTDYIDANGLGLWGEGNLVGIPTPNDNHDQERAYYDWHLGIYAQAFTKVILAVNPCTFGSWSNNGAEQIKTDLDIPIGKYGCVWRRDGIGQDVNKPYIQPTSSQLAPFNSTFPACPIICEPWSGFASTNRDYMNRLFNDVILHHGNALSYDAGWDANPDLLAKLITKLGYRLRPVKIELQDQVKSSGTMQISHTWTNDGVGALPNGNIRWNNKYAIAFALFKYSEHTPTKVYVDSKSNPGVLVNGSNTTYTTDIQWNVPAGDYWLAVGIIDQTKPTTPSLDLAIKALGRRNGWYLLKTITIDAD